MIQVNEDKDATFDLKDAESDDEDYKGDIKSKDYENEKLQKVEKLTSPSAPSPDDSETVKKTNLRNPKHLRYSIRPEEAQRQRPQIGDLGQPHLLGLRAT